MLLDAIHPAPDTLFLLITPFEPSLWPVRWLPRANCAIPQASQSPRLAGWAPFHLTLHLFADMAIDWWPQESTMPRSGEVRD